MDVATDAAVPLLAQTVGPLLAWYRENGRDLPWRTEPSPYRVWVSEIMLQQTRIGAVLPYFDRFMTAFPDIAALAAASDEQLLKSWEGLGYYRRVRNLRAAARLVLARFGGELPSAREDLLTLPGIGDYTAGAIASIAFGRPEPAVDGNVMRVTARLLDCHADVTRPALRETVRRQWAQVWPSSEAGMFTQALMELGEVRCLPHGTPVCQQCPCRDICRSRAAGTALELPYRAAAKERPVEERTFLLLVSGGKIALCQRPENGLLGGMWEFPSAPGLLDAAGAARLLRSWGAVHAVPVPVGTARHLFTHREWRMTGYLAVLPDRTGDWVWGTPQDLKERYALPAACHFFRDRLAAFLAEPEQQSCNPGE